MSIASVRPQVKVAFFLACLITLAAVYFSNTPLPFFQTRLKQLALTALLLWSSGAWGLRILHTPRLRSNLLNPLETILFAETIGLGFFSLVMIGLGAFALWIPLTGWALVISGLAIGKPLFQIFQQLLLPSPSTRIPLASFAVWTGGILSFLLALAPITYYDSLVYHLALPSMYLRAHQWVPLPGLIYSAFPQTLEMLWTLALLIADNTVVNLVAWSLSMLLLVAVISFARRFIDLAVGWMAAALLAVMPAWLLLSSGGYVDIGLTFFGFMALYAACLWKQDPSVKWLILSGLFAGWTVGTKYTGGLTAGLLAVLLGIGLFQKGRKDGLAGLFTFGGCAMLVFSPWLIKNTLFVGNPVFPFLYHLGIKALNPWVHDAAAGYFAGVTEYFSRSFWTLPAVLWETAVNGLSFGRGIDVLGDFGWIPFIALLPALWLCHERPYPIKLLLIFSGSFFVFWAISRPVLRFLLPISPIVALLAAYGWVYGVRPLPLAARWIARGVLGTFLLSGLFLFFYTTSVTSPFGVALGLENRQSYLARMLDYYAAATFVNTQTPANSRVYILGDQRSYYYERDVVISPVFSRNPLTEWANSALTANALKQKLKEEGITHIVVNRSEFERLKAAYPALRFTPQGQHNWDALQTKGLMPLYHDRACDVYAL